MKYCTLCQRKVDPVKKKFSWGVFILCLGVFYIPYRIFLAKKNRCPICQTKRLEKYSPEELEVRKQKKEEKKEKRAEAFNNIKDKITGE